MSSITNLLRRIEDLYPLFENVQLNENNIESLVKNINFSHKNKWDQDFIYHSLTEDSLIYLSLFSAISFCYWDNPEWYREFKGKKLWGSYALFYSLKLAIQKGFAINKANYLSKISISDFKTIIQGENGVLISNWEERYEIARKFGETLQIKFNGSFLEIIKQANRDAVKTNDILVDSFDIFKDVHFYKNTELNFFKKSQEAITLIYEQFEGEGLGNIKNTQNLTASSDYKLPQVLSHYGLLIYSKNLQEKIENEVTLFDSDDETLEIRMATILICHKISKYLSKKLKRNVREIEISNLLWTSSQSLTALRYKHPRIKSTWV